MKTGNYNNFHECVSRENVKLVYMFSGRFLRFCSVSELKQTVLE